MALPLLRARLGQTLLTRTTRSLSPLPRSFFSLSFFDSNRSKKDDPSSSPPLKQDNVPPPNDDDNNSDNNKNLFDKINTNNNISSSHDDWEDVEDRIIRDIEPIVRTVKDILHSHRYSAGDRLTPDDEKAVVERLLAYHPCSEDKIGCGLDCIMVDWHPLFPSQMCLFVVRTDGGWIDFSYQKCLREYVRKTYPSYAERFASEKLFVSFDRRKQKFRLLPNGR